MNRRRSRTHRGKRSRLALLACWARENGARSRSSSPLPTPRSEGTAMPLSDEEQKILKEIEAQLNATDPALVEQVSRTTLYRHSARMIRWAALGFLGGLVLLVLTFADERLGRRRRLRGHARLPARHRAQRPQAREGRHGEHHRRLEGRRRDPRDLRRARARLARALPPRRHLTSGGVHRRASGATHRLHGLAAPPLGAARARRAERTARRRLELVRLP